MENLKVFFFWVHLGLPGKSSRLDLSAMRGENGGWAGFLVLKDEVFQSRERD